MTDSPGNGKETGAADYQGYALYLLGELARDLTCGMENMAAETGELISSTLLASPASQRAEIYAALKDAIAGLPAEIQSKAYTFAGIAPDKPDLIAAATAAFARALGVDEEELSGEQPEDEEKPKPRLVPDIPIINPALDFTNGVVYIAQQRTVMGDDEVLRSVPIIFTSDGDYFMCPQVKIANEIKLINKQVAVDKGLECGGQRWSLPAIQDFIQFGGHPVCPWQLYHKLESLYQERIWFAEEGNYVILSLYTLLSYIYPVFDAIPYLHLTGLAGTGKTHVARIVAALAFNGHVEVDPTEASLFRTIEATRGLVVLDDQETGVTNRKHSDNPFMTILKTGYKRGARVTRLERRGNDFVPLTFDVFSPKIITNVFGLEDILADRTIPILMREMPQGLDRRINTSPLRPEESQPLVDDLFLFAMRHTAPIAKLASEPSQHQSRTEEIFWPLYVLATYIDIHSPAEVTRSLLGDLGGILEEKISQRKVIKSDTPEQTLKLALLNLLEIRGVDADWFSTREIEIEFYKLHSSPPDWYNDRWLGRNIGKVVALRDQDRRRDPLERTVPRFDYKTGRELDELETKRFTNYFIRREAL